ncbi:MAG: hypothetical protein HUJ86_06555, partial [Synergistes sp.]|nr:hypothetical protein [Synergistes sp.]
NYNFNLPTDFAANDTMLTIGGSGIVDMNGTKVGMEKAFNGTIMKAGDTFNLIKGTLINTPTDTIVIKEGIATYYNADTVYNNGLFFAEISGAPTTLSVDIYDTKDGPKYRVEDDPVPGGITSQDGEYTLGTSVDLQVPKIANAYGGYTSEDGTDAKNNKITVNKDSVAVDKNIYGGYTEGSGSNAVSNDVTITGGTIGGTVYGGYVSKDGNAAENKVTVTDGTIGGATGGYTTSGDATDNEITIAGGKIDGDVIGGRSENGNAADNNVKIAGGETTGDVYGGYAGGKGNVSDNKITITGGSVDGSLYGGFTADGTASGNEITLSAGTVDRVIGGYAENGEAYGNKINFAGGKVTGDVILNAVGTGSVKGSTFEITDKAEVGGTVYSAYVSKDGSAENNKLTISGGNIGGATAGYTNKGNASGNVLTIDGGKVSGNAVAGMTVEGNAFDNTAILNGGEVADLYAALTGKGDASNNTVTLNGGKADNVYGGYTNSGNAIGNTVNWYGGDITGGLYGGISEKDGISANNTLNMYVSNKTVQYVGGFQNYYFYLPEGYNTAADTMLSVSGNKNVDLNETTFGIAQMKVGTVKEGDKISLIKMTGEGSLQNIEKIKYDVSGMTIKEGMATLRDVNFADSDAKNLVASVGESSAPDAKAFSEGIAAAQLIINSAADLIIDRGMDAA